MVPLEAMAKQDPVVQEGKTKIKQVELHWSFPRDVTWDCEEVNLQTGAPSRKEGKGECRCKNHEKEEWLLEVEEIHLERES